MRLSELIIENFRVHDHLKLDIPNVLVVTGDNGTGKSTLQAALEWGVSSRCAYTDERGTWKVPTDPAPTVTLHTTAGSFCRTPKTQTWTTLTDALTGKAAQQGLETALGCTGETARIALRASRFFSLDGKKQAAMLQELLNLSSPDVVGVLQAEQGEEAVQVAEKVYKKTLQGLQVENLEAVRKACYDHRTDTNRHLRSLKEQQDAAKRELAVKKPERLWDDACTAEFESLKQQLELILKQQGQHEQQSLRLIQLRDEHVALTLQATLEPAALQHNLPLLEQELKSLRAQWSQLDAEQQVRANLVVEQQQLMKDWVTLQQTAQGGGTCPWRPGYACQGQHDQDNLRMESARIQKRIADLQVGPDRQPELTALGGRIADAGQRMTLALAGQQERERAATAQARIEQNLIEQQKIEQALQNQQEQDLTREPAIRQAIATLEQARQQQIAYTELVSRNQILVGQLKVEDHQRKVLDGLVEFFGPLGLRARLLEEATGPFLVQLRRVLDRWGWEARYEADAIQLRRAGSERWLTYEELSDAEQIEDAFAHQVAFSKLTGLGWVVVDRIEALDLANQIRLINAAVDVTSGPDAPIEQVLLLGVNLNFATNDLEAPGSVNVLRLEPLPTVLPVVAAPTPESPPEPVKKARKGARK